MYNADTTPKAPRMCTYIESTLDIEQWNRSKPIRAVYNTPHEAFCIALFLTNCVVNCQIPTRQNQSVQKRLISYVCLSNLCQLRLSVWMRTYKSTIFSYCMIINHKKTTRFYSRNKGKS